MQPFDVCCPECSSTLRVAIAELIGRKVRCPQCRTPFLIVEPTPAEQIGSGVLIGAGSGVGPYESKLNNWQEPPPEANVLEEESEVESDDVLSGEEPDPSSYEEPAAEEAAELTEADAEEPSAVEYAEDEAEPEAETEEAAEGDEDLSVESDYDEEPSRSSYSRPARGAGIDQKQTLMLAGALGAGLLLCVTAFFLLGGSGEKSRNGRSRTGKVERRDPRAFQDFARQAERQGW